MVWIATAVICYGFLDAVASFFRRTHAARMQYQEAARIMKWEFVFFLTKNVFMLGFTLGWGLYLHFRGDDTINIYILSTFCLINSLPDIYLSSMDYLPAIKHYEHKQKEKESFNIIPMISLAHEDSSSAMSPSTVSTKSELENAQSPNMFVVVTSYSSGEVPQEKYVR